MMILNECVSVCGRRWKKEDVRESEAWVGQEESVAFEPSAGKSVALSQAAKRF